jgi:transposase
MDEARFGLQTIRRRRITRRGVKPIGLYQHDYANFYLYGAVAPRSGEAFLATHRALNAATFQTFLDDFAAAYPDRFHIMLLDNAQAHKAKALVIPANIALLFQPPFAPELNPVERVWLALKAALAWFRCTDLYTLQERLATLLNDWSDATFQSLCAYPFLLDAINALSS